jgi:hypothetical protein
MRIREAQARYSSMVLVPSDPARDARALEMVMVALENITAFIECSHLLFPTVGCLRYFGSEQFWPSWSCRVSR